MHFGQNAFIGDRVVIFQDKDGGPVKLCEPVHIYGKTFIQAGSDGSLKIGDNLHLHPRCRYNQVFKSDRACLGRLAGKSSLLNQVTGNASVDDAEHLAHDGRAAREQET